MNLRIRPPRDEEWRICRMLLPETFAGSSTRWYVLAVRDEDRRTVAAASFRQSPDGVTHLRLHVLPPFRRRGVGSQVVAYLAQGGAKAIWGTAEIARDRVAEAFCERNGFRREETLTTVEAEIGEMREYLGRLRARVPLPAGAQFVPLTQAPADQVAYLHAQYVAQEGELNPWRALVAHTPGMELSPVLMVDCRVAGILLGTIEGATAVVRSRVAAPGHRRGWVNLMLLAEALDRAWANGARRARFSYTDSNRDTQKLAIRFKAEVASVVARFVRRPSE